jgi:hypothetical protein
MIPRLHRGDRTFKSFRVHLYTIKIVLIPETKPQSMTDCQYCESYVLEVILEYGFNVLGEKVESIKKSEQSTLSV